MVYYIFDTCCILRTSFKHSYAVCWKLCSKYILCTETYNQMNMSALEKEVFDLLYLLTLLGGNVTIQINIKNTK